jgi:RHS repeat-associated protein
MQGPQSGTASVSWVSNPSSCTWTATNAAGASVQTVETMTTTASVASGITYIHTDGLGSPVARTNSGGALISVTRYEPYGLTSSGATPTIGFTGHVNDADTGLTYMQQRYYDPVAGRFLSIDPVTTDVNTGGSFNRYAYGANNPYKYVDPDGRFGVVGAIVGMTVEIGLQVAMNGRVSNWTAVGVSGAVGVVTGGLGGLIGRAAVAGTVTTGRAVLAAASVGGAASGIGKVIEGKLTGKNASAGEVAVAVATGALGSAAGTKVGLSYISNVESMAASSGIQGHIGATTQASLQQSGRVAEPAATIGQSVTQRAADVGSTYAEKKINP